MVEVSQADREEMQRAAAMAMVGEDAEEMAAAESLDDIRDLFCQHWPTVKQVLKFLADNVGGVVKWAAKAIIAAGDVAHGRLCD